MEMGVDGNVILQFNFMPDHHFVVKVHNEKLITHLDGHEIRQGREHRRLTITIIVESQNFNR